jgi:hypothetical protein
VGDVFLWSWYIYFVDQLITFKEPFSLFTNKEVAARVVQGYRLPCPKACPTELYDSVMLPCWNHDPELRPTFKEIFEKLCIIEENVNSERKDEDNANVEVRSVGANYDVVVYHLGSVSEDDEVHQGKSDST